LSAAAPARNEATVRLRRVADMAVGGLPGVRVFFRNTPQFLHPLSHRPRGLSDCPLARAASVRAAVQAFQNLFNMPLRHFDSLRASRDHKSTLRADSDPQRNAVAFHFPPQLWVFLTQSPAVGGLLFYIYQKKQEVDAGCD